MDFKNFETCTTLAIEAVYRDYWNQIPERYRLAEKAQRHDGIQDKIDNFDSYKQQSKPLTYKDVDKQEHKVQLDEYGRYCACLNNPEQYFDLQPFFDPQMDFENRLHYKLVGISYPERNHPWFVITWNQGSGILKSSLTNRRFDTTTVETLSGEKVKFDFMDTNLDLTLCFNSNSLQALMELQEIIRIGRREKATVATRKHSIIGSFPVALDLIDVGQIAKSSRDKGTLCTLTLTFKLDYKIIGNVQSAENIGIIREIHTEIDEPWGTGPDEHQVLSRDIINSQNLY